MARFVMLLSGVGMFLFSCRSGGSDAGLKPPEGLDYGRTAADSLGVLLRWLEGQRGIAAETMRVKVATALAGKLQFSAPDSAWLLLERAREAWERLSAQPALNQEKSFLLLKAAILRTEGELYRMRRDYDRAMGLYRSALAIAESLGSGADMADALNSIGNIYNDRSQYEQALEHYRRALRLCEELGDKIGQAVIVNNIGSIYNDRSEYGQALEHYRRAFRIFEELGDKRGQAFALVNIGNIYTARSEYGQALEYYLRALRFYEELGDKTGQAIILGNMGTIYTARSEYGQALEHYLRALRLHEELVDRRGQAIVLGNIGNVYKARSDYEHSLKYYQLSLNIFDEIGDKIGQTIVLGSIGDIYSARSEYKRALEHYQRALPIFEELDDKSGQAIVLANLGRVYTKLGRFREAERCLRLAIQMDSSLGTQGQLMGDYFALSDLYEVLGGRYRRVGAWAESAGYFERSLEAYKRGSVLKDTLFGEESRKQVMRKELEYEYEKKRIEEQARHEVELARREARLRQQRVGDGFDRGSFGGGDRFSGVGGAAASCDSPAEAGSGGTAGASCGEESADRGEHPVCASDSGGDSAV